MKVLLSLIIFVEACALQAQPMFTLAPGAHRIYYAGCGLPPTLWPAGNPSVVGGQKLNIAVYGAPAGTPLWTKNGVPDFAGYGWQMMVSPVITNLILPGRFTGKGVVMPASLGPGGTPIQCIVVGWSGNYPDFASAAGSAYAWIGWAGRLRGDSGWLQPTGSLTIPVVCELPEDILVGAWSWTAPAPAGLTAEARDGFVNVSWGASLFSLGYSLQRSVGGGAFETLGEERSGKTNYTDVNVREGISYSYRAGAWPYGCDMQPAYCEPVTVTARRPPALSAHLGPGGQTLMLTWPESAASYTAFSTTNLAMTNSWQALTNATSVSEGVIQVTIPASEASARFFRLRAP